MTVLLALLFWSAQAWAECTCDPAPIQAIYENPVPAETAFIGKSEGKGKKRNFKVLMSWTRYKESVKSPLVSECSLKTKTGKTYLVYSILTTEEIEKRKIGMGICDSFASEIQDAEPIVEKLVDKRVNNDVSPNPSWFYCTQDKDCVTEKGVCQDAVGVHKEFRERMKLWVMRMAPTVNCLKSRDRASGKVFCKNYFCQAEVKPPAFIKEK